MESKASYQFNPILLFFHENRVEEDFNKSFFKQDLYGLRFVIALGALLSLAFIFVDVFRYEFKVISALFRGGMAVILIIFGLFTFLFKEDKYQLTQYIAMTVAMLVISVFFVHYDFNKDPNFRIFLSNILTVLFFIIATVMGLRFRYAILVISLAFVGYVVYIEWFNFSYIADRQISQLVVVYFVSIAASYVLERQKIVSFIIRQELNNEKEHVEELNHVKNKLFSVISHDLRGPIVSLKGIVSLFNKDVLSKEELKHLTQDLERNLQNTSILMDNLLAWAKSQLDGIRIKPENFSLHDQVGQIQRLYRVQVESKALQWVMDIPKEANVYADREMMHIAIRNLISNAIKFTPHGGQISVHAQDLGESWELSIRDSGPGIEADKLETLFVLDKESLVGNTSASGAGIGLFLVKEFVELNEGSVLCSSRIDEGTAFTLVLPKAK